MTDRQRQTERERDRSETETDREERGGGGNKRYRDVTIIELNLANVRYFSHATAILRSAIRTITVPLLTGHYDQFENVAQASKRMPIILAAQRTKVCLWIG